MRAQRRRLLLAGLGAACTLPAVLHALGASDERVVRVVARKFVFLPNDITLKLGAPVMLEFTAPEVVMGFNVPALKVRTDIIPGQVARLRSVPQQIGTYDFLCDIFCGEGHEGMVGTLRVVA